ncbi:MAG TPA: hypothetical protein VJU77_16850 [Chthoniobacterales bacterium]|nr:hypothetical protein [Chthoniobacterales bacterium]
MNEYASLVSTLETSVEQLNQLDGHARNPAVASGQAYGRSASTLTAWTSTQQPPLQEDVRERLESAKTLADQLRRYAFLWEHVVGLAHESLADREAGKFPGPLSANARSISHERNGYYRSYGSDSWREIARRTLETEPSGIARCPVATVIDTGGAGSPPVGHIVEIEVMVFPENVAVAIPHPLQAGDGDEEFREAAGYGWHAADTFIQTEQSEALQKEGRISQGDPANWIGHFGTWHRVAGPAFPLKGRSAAGALALAWSRALRRQKYDFRVIVFATVDDTGHLVRLSDPSSASCQAAMEAKVDAVLRDGRIDTIATVGDHLDQIVDLLKGQDAVSVVNVATGERSLHSPRASRRNLSTASRSRRTAKRK